MRAGGRPGAGHLHGGQPGADVDEPADHGRVGAAMAVDGGDCESVIAGIEGQGVDVAEVAARLQKEGGEAFAKSWSALLSGLHDKTAQLAGAHAA